MWTRRIISLLTVSACLGLVGCGQSPSEKLVGKWQYNPIGQNESTGGLIADSVQTLGQMAALEIEFKSDQTLLAGCLGLNIPGTIHWSVSETDGDRVTLQLSGEDGKNAIDLKITFVDDDHLRAGPPGTISGAWLFERVAAE
jgi:hypothetical protein